MEKFLMYVGATGLVILFILLFPLIGTLFGALSGWVVGWFFSETILSFFTELGVTSSAMWQIGASLGFIGGFFKTIQYNTKK